VDHVQKVVVAVRQQLNGLAVRSPRTRRSVHLNEANLDQLSQLISLLRTGPHAGNRRVRRQASGGLITSTATNGLNDMMMMATNLSNGIRRRLTSISSQIADLTANGVLQLNDAATNTVQGAANAIGSLSNSAVGTVNTVTGQISNAISNGVKQVNSLAQNSLG
jgi:hypothetical protein